MTNQTTCAKCGGTIQLTSKGEPDHIQSFKVRDHVIASEDIYLCSYDAEQFERMYAKNRETYHCVHGAVRKRVFSHFVKQHGISPYQTDWNAKHSELWKKKYELLYRLMSIMDVRVLRKFLNQDGKELPKLGTDSDRVMLIEKVGWWKQVKAFFKGGHTLIDKHDGSGFVELTCAKSGNHYRHFICCPNKFAIICRGCGKIIQ